MARTAVEAKHGTYSCYTNLDCRCVDCCNASVRYQARAQARRRARYASQVVTSEDRKNGITTIKQKIAATKKAAKETK